MLYTNAWRGRGTQSVGSFQQCCSAENLSGTAGHAPSYGTCGRMVHYTIEIGYVYFRYLGRGLLNEYQ